MLLLLPTAWLLQHRQAWAVAIPLATSVVVLFIVPAAAYPVAFWVALIAVVVVGIRESGRATSAGTPNAGSSKATA
jgi:lysylphosphatidylglycerol synthetase-like protein (DUF2156 family)